MGYAKLISEYTRPLSPLPTSMRPAGRLEDPIRCILFDIYGTLFISASGDLSITSKTSPEAGKLQRLVQKYNILKTPRNLTKELFRAIKNEHRQLREDGIDYPEIKIDRIWKQILESDDLGCVRRFALEFELIVNPVFPMPNLAKILTACREQNLKMGLISNAQFFTPLLFESFLHAKPKDLGFDSQLIFLSYQFGRAKPSLFPFEKAATVLKRMDLRTVDCLYVGNDMLNDIYPAKQLGFQTALFAGDARSLRMRTDDARCADFMCMNRFIGS